jgi:hypothetical protein
MWSWKVLCTLRHYGQGGAGSSQSYLPTPYHTVAGSPLSCEPRCQTLSVLGREPLRAGRALTLGSLSDFSAGMKISRFPGLHNPELEPEPCWLLKCVTLSTLGIQGWSWWCTLAVSSGTCLSPKPPSRLSLRHRVEGNWHIPQWPGHLVSTCCMQV